MKSLVNPSVPPLSPESLDGLTSTTIENGVPVHQVLPHGHASVLQGYDPEVIRETYQDQRRKSIKRWYEITKPLVSLFAGRWWDKKNRPRG